MNKQQISHQTAIVKQIANNLGFMSCGISKAEFLEKEATRLEQWLKKGMHGSMSYMENYFDKRLNPTLLVEGAKSVVTLLLNYYPEQKQNATSPQISKYAYGNDYHEVIKAKTKKFIEQIRQQIGEVQGRAFVDSAPVMDKVWAQKSGLGWIGKNSNVIQKQSGSFFFIAHLIIDLDLDYENITHQDFCGTCTKCLDACPTQAIVAPYIVDGSKCISYFTIELKESIPQEYQNKLSNWIFGCDICQDVCPWNRFSKPHQEPDFINTTGILDFETKDWAEITESTFSTYFKNSAIKRPKFKGLKRNLDCYVKNVGN